VDSDDMALMMTRRDLVDKNILRDLEDDVAFPD